MATGSQDPTSKPLHFMEKISPIVSSYRPPPSADTSNAASHPELIIIASWSDARDVHLVKYITKYQESYPAAQILLIKSTTQLFINTSAIGAAVRPAVDVVRAAIPSASASSSAASPRILIHIFSNGGSSSISNLYDQYAATAKEGEDKQIPRHITIFDSAPSVFRLDRAVAFLNAGMGSPVARMVATPLFYLLTAGWSAMITLGVWEDTLVVWGNDHNNPEKVLETRRMYVYSDADKLINPVDVEAHADEAEKKGFSVKKEKFLGSGHVSHARKHEDRYWEVVRSTWDGSYTARL